MLYFCPEEIVAFLNLLADICDKKETKNDFDTAAYGVNMAEGHRCVFAATERLAVPRSRPAAAVYCSRDCGGRLTSLTYRAL